MRKIKHTFTYSVLLMMLSKCQCLLLTFNNAQFYQAAYAYI